MKFFYAAAIALLAAACSQPSVGQPTARPGFPEPDRPIAEIVSSTWSSGPDRDKADESGQLIRALGVGPGMAVADIGAGSGYHALRLSPVVGPEGRVYAQDVTEAYLAQLRQELTRRGISNVEIVVGAADDPKLPPAAVDRAILAHMYHEIAQPYALMWNLVPSLRPGARVGILDVDRLPEHHGTPPALLKCELEAVGYRQTDFLTLQGGLGYLAIFEPPALDARPAPEDIRPCRHRRGDPVTGG
ncbi:class I SAM-dependent methyltransferase [Phenylobacterium sp.]|jgi:SAM-dependent methyltransferase|uniref:class I SAM-dependent methyltransferase n=1 Tax=Phenylobacterium sp. TaxID=1871053 RepID=UPI002E2FBF4D|nr:methyltransferase domain-containing protein [Phenylobacterium sp.]HEX2561420.1 methyltransferase domain-containing protein [Phenylobacterium sp.]